MLYGNSNIGLTAMGTQPFITIRDEENICCYDSLWTTHKTLSCGPRNSGPSSVAKPCRWPHVNRKYHVTICFISINVNPTLV